MRGSIRSGRDDREILLDDLKRAGVQAKRAGDILDQIRQFVGREKARRERVDVNQSIRESLALLQGETRQSRARVEVALEAELPPVLGEPVQITQVLVNLLRNALEAVNVEGVGKRRVIIATRRAEADTIEVSVSDTGVGISPEAEARLFERFFTTKAHGMGMGLTIARSIVEKHGGRLRLESNPGGGSTARFTLRGIVGEERHEDRLDGICR